MGNHYHLLLETAPVGAPPRTDCLDHPQSLLRRGGRRQAGLLNDRTDPYAMNSSLIGPTPLFPPVFLPHCRVPVLRIACTLATSDKNVLAFVAVLRSGYDDRDRLG
jgi:hypothetical protein